MNIINNLQNQGLKQINKVVKKDDYYFSNGLENRVQEILTQIQNPDKYGDMINRNTLFKGSAGVGKTHLIHYIATELDMPLYDGKGIFSPQQVAQLFDSLRKEVKRRKTNNEGPIGLLLDEADRLRKRDGFSDPQQEQALRYFLLEMDGSESNDGIYIFATTNKPNDLDPALRRFKRFGDEVEIMPPDKAGRLNLLNLYAKKKHSFTFDEGVIPTAAAKTFGYTPADLLHVMNKMFVKADVDGKEQVELEHLTKALDEVKPSAIKDMPFIEPKIALGNLGGYEMHKDFFMSVLKNSKGSTLMLYGDKGVGKSEFCEALAGEFGYNYIKIKGDELEDKFVGETGKRIDDVLERAKLLAPCIVNFDEMESMLEKTGTLSHKGSWTGRLQAHLSKPIEGVYIFATTNRPDNFPRAFKDRFIHKVYFGMPNVEDQKDIWSKYVGPEVNVNDLVEANNKLSCRDIYKANRVISEYGVEPTTENFIKLTAKYKTTEDEMYKQFLEEEGSSVDDFKAALEIINSTPMEETK